MQPPPALAERMPKRPPADDVSCAAIAPRFVPTKTTALFKSTLALKLVCLGVASQLSEGVAQTSGVFSPTGNLLAPRFYHTATRLADGRVLIVGGTTDTSPENTLSSAEIYDPDKEEFIRTGSMLTPRRAHTATYLASGKVLIAGGCDPKGSLTTAELYDPASGTFTLTTGSMNHAQGWHTATLLHNGKVLIAGGITATGPVLPGHAALYDPNTGTFSAISLNHRLVCPAATLLPEGRVLIAAGRILAFVGSVGSSGFNYALVRLSFESSQLFDPVANTFSATGDIPLHTTYWHTSTLLKNGMVLIAGGGDADEGYRSVSASLFDPGRKTFSEIGPTLGTRMLHTATLLNDGSVLIAGGTDPSSELYDPSTQKFSSNAMMNENRTGHTATLLNDGRVLLVGGTRNNQGSAEIYRPLLVIPTATVSDLRFDRTEVVAGNDYAVIISGAHLTPETYFDVRISTGSETHVVLNWQKGLTVSRHVPADAAAGGWTINGVRAHHEEADHTGDFTPLSASITIVP